MTALYTILLVNAGVFAAMFLVRRSIVGPAITVAALTGIAPAIRSLI